MNSTFPAGHAFPTYRAGRGSPRSNSHCDKKLCKTTSRKTRPPPGFPGTDPGTDPHAASSLLHAVLHEDAIENGYVIPGWRSALPPSLSHRLIRGTDHLLPNQIIYFFFFNFFSGVVSFHENTNSMKVGIFVCFVRSWMKHAENELKGWGKLLMYR